MQEFDWPAQRPDINPNQALSYRCSQIHHHMLGVMFSVPTNFLYRSVHGYRNDVGAERAHKLLAEAFRPSTQEQEETESLSFPLSVSIQTELNE